MVGQHIRILKDGRWIHAVDCGDETVLHLAEEAPPPRVRRAYRPEFVAGAATVEVVTHRERTFPAKDIVRRAYSRASDPALASMFCDSEAFVEWCTTGRLSGARNFAVDATAAAPATAPAKPATNGASKATAKAASPAAAAKPKPAPKLAAKPRAAAKKPKTRLAPRPRPAKAKAKAKPAARRAVPRSARRRPVKAKPARRSAKAARKAKR